MARFGAVLGFVCVGAAACANDVIIVEHGGTTSSAGATGSSSGGAGGALPRTIDVSLTIEPPTADPHRVLVVVNHGDGTFVSALFGEELPAKVEVSDGDLVSYAYVSTGDGPYLESFRVTPSTVAITDTAILEYFDFECPNVEVAHVTLDVPALPASAKVTAYGRHKGYAEDFGTPAHLEFDAETCAGDDGAVLVRVASASGGVEAAAVQLFENLPATGNVDLVATFPQAPRQTMTIEIPALPELHTISGAVGWSGSQGANGLHGETWYLDYTNEPGPHTLTGDPLTFAIGRQSAYLDGHVYTVNGCMNTIELFRWGAASAPIQFDALDLAEPGVSGDGWTLGPGKLGDALALHVELTSEHRWTIVETPGYGPFPIAMPSLPGGAPSGWPPLEGPPTITYATHAKHVEDDGVTDVLRTEIFSCAP